MTHIIVGLIALFAGGWTVQWAAWIYSRRDRRRLRADRRLGLLGTGNATSAEARRAARLVELGNAGTYTTHNCGEILHVDYDRGILTCARDGYYR